MRWAKVMAVLSGVILVLSTSGTMNKFAAGQEPISLTFEMNGCKNDLTCGAEFLVGDTVTFTGAVTTENGTPVPGANLEIVKFLPKPEIVVIASGVTGIDGTYSISWAAEFTQREKVGMDVTKKFLDENVVFFAQFEGDEQYAEVRSGKLSGTIRANHLFTSVNAEKRVYTPGESALIFIAFIDSNDQFVDADTIRVVYDDQEVDVERKKTGSYTLVTPALTLEHHQVIVLPKKGGYNLENGFLTVQVSGFFGKV